MLRGEWIVGVPVDEVSRVPGGEIIGLAARRMGGLGVTILPLTGPQGERGALVYSPPPTVGQSSRSAQAVAIAARYASAAISVWADLPKLPQLSGGISRGPASN